MGSKLIRTLRFVQIGGMPEVAAALSKKIIAAAPMSYPMVYIVEQAGAKMLANLAKDEIPFGHLTLTTTKKFVKEKRPAGESVLARVRQSDAFYLHQAGGDQSDLR